MWLVAVPLASWLWWVAKDRATKRVSAELIERKDAPTLQGFVESHRNEGATAYTDDFPSYKCLENHEIVKHSVREYVNGQAHTNGMESFWGMLKRGYHGVYHYDLDTLGQMRDVVAGLVGQRLLWRELTAKEARLTSAFRAPAPSRWPAPE